MKQLNPSNHFSFMSKHMKNIIFLITLFALLSCEEGSKTPQRESSTSLSSQAESQLYDLIKAEVKRQKASVLTECNCLKAYYRDWNEGPNLTARYAFDRSLGKHAILTTEGQSKARILAIGPGTLLNELTAFSYTLALGKDLEIYLLDYLYIFYGQDNFEEQAIAYGKNRDSIPEGWKGFFFWKNYKERGEKAYLERFRKHHRAIDTFKAIIRNIAQFYGRTVSIKVIDPPTHKKIKLPELDLVMTIDAFQDLPNVMYHFFYSHQLTEKSVRFIGLNKIKPLGGFWEPENDALLLQSLTLEVYDLTSTPNFGTYSLIKKETFSPNEEQKEKAPRIENNELKPSQGIVSS